MRAPAKRSWRVGLALALVSTTCLHDAAAQNVAPPAVGAAPTVGPYRGGGGGRFPVGLGIGLGLGLGAAILGGIASSRRAPVEAAPYEPPREPYEPRAPRLRPTRVSTHRVRVPTETVGPQTSQSRHHGSSGPTAQVSRSGFVIPPATERRYAADEVLVVTRGALSPAALRRLATTLGLTPVTSARIGLLDADLRLFRLRPGASVPVTIRALRGQKLVAEAEPNFAYELQDDPKAAAGNAVAPPVGAEPLEPDKAAPVQYAVTALHLEEAHRASDGENVRVAIIDSGIDDTNPELKDAIVARFDAIGGTFVPQAHGTAMAGAIVAHQTLVGVAPKARLIAIRAFAGTASRGTGSGFNVLRGLDFAADHAARVINMSFAGPRDLLVGQALAAARKRGIVAIAAAGNAGPAAQPLYPGAEDGSHRGDGDGRGTARPFAQANRGAYVAIAAPGVDVIAPGLGGAVQMSTGTSIACAEASGVAALVLARQPAATPDALRKILTGTARPLAEEPSAAGAGLIDAAAAVRSR